MKIKPILFSTDMVYAILSGIKTQTRRIVKFNKKIEVDKIGFASYTPDGEFTVRGIHENGKYGSSNFKLPYFTNDIMWVRETFRLTDWIHPSDEDYGYIYKASQNGIDWEKSNPHNWKWKPSIFMPKAACRIFNLVENVRIERLQSISEEDALAEGVTTLFPKTSEHYNANTYKNYTWHGIGGDDSFSGYSSCETAKDSFQSLWYAINGKESWDQNPYVFAYDFSLTKRPDGFLS